MLVVAILASVVVVMVDSVPRIHSHPAHWLAPLEWAFTVILQSNTHCAWRWCDARCAMRSARGA